MDYLDNEKTRILNIIVEARRKLSIELKNEMICEQDIIDLLYARQNFGLKTINRQYSYKESVLKSIFNSPFILCEQDLLSAQAKKALPKLLKTRYLMELEELKSHLKNNFISYNEYIFLKSLINFSYFESSEDGKYIKEYGHCKCFCKKR